MKDLSVIGNQVREYYISRLLAARDEALVGGDVELEMPLCDEDGTVKLEGRLATGVRVDIVVFSGDTPIRSINVDTESMLDFGEILVECAGQSIRVFAFQWNCLKISMDAVGNSCVEAALVNWFNVWFAYEGDDFAPLFGCVHFIADMYWNGFRGSTTIDMGSASVGALVELIDALKHAGASEIEIGTRNGQE